MNLRRQEMDEALPRAGLDALLLWRPEEIVMLTGRAPHWGLTVALARPGRPVVLWMPGAEPEMTPVADCEVRAYPWGEPGRDAWGELERELQAECAGLRVGAKRGSNGSAPAGNAAEWPPLDDVGLLRLAPGDATRCVDRLLSHKTPDEARCLRRANSVARRGLEAGRARLRPGLSEAEVAATIEAEIHGWTGRAGIGLARAWAAVQSGPNAALAGRYSRSGGRRLAEGDTVVIELATCVDGYWSDLTRTLVVGEASEKVAEVLALVAAANAAAVARLRPGVCAEEVDAAAREVIAAAGWGRHFPHATGHPTGFRYHDPGPLLQPGERTRIEAGMVLTIEPGIYSAELGFGCRLEENAFVTADGCEVLSAATDQALVSAP